MPHKADAEDPAALWLCVAGLLGVFAVGYPGYFVFDAFWPSFYYSPVVVEKNVWLMSQAFLSRFISPARRSDSLERAALSTGFHPWSDDGLKPTRSDR